MRPRIVFALVLGACALLLGVAGEADGKDAILSHNGVDESEILASQGGAIQYVNRKLLRVLSPEVEKQGEKKLLTLEDEADEDAEDEMEEEMLEEVTSDDMGEGVSRGPSLEFEEEFTD